MAAAKGSVLENDSIESVIGLKGLSILLIARRSPRLNSVDEYVRRMLNYSIPTNGAALSLDQSFPKLRRIITHNKAEYPYR